MCYRGVSLGGKGSTQFLVNGAQREIPQELLQELKVICQVWNKIIDIRSTEVGFVPETLEAFPAPEMNDLYMVGQPRVLRDSNQAITPAWIEVKEDFSKDMRRRALGTLARN